MNFQLQARLHLLAPILLRLRKYDLRWLGVLVSISALLTLGTAITLLYVPSAPLVPG
jgi:hypothetical protein